MKIVRYGTMVLLLTVWATAGQAQTRMHVQVREGQVRERPSFLGNVAAVLDYGDRVQVLREQGPWRWVEADDFAGWMHESALTRQRIKLAVGEEDAAGVATEQEIALAGKGFSQEVESEFRNRHTDINFEWVDRMETFEVETQRLIDFLQAGGLSPAEGGGQ